MKIHFEIHHVVGSEVEELDEDRIARRLDEDPTFVEALREPSELDGALSIDGVQIGDALSPLVQRLCFEAVAVLVAPDAVFAYSYFTDTGAFELRATNGLITWHGDQVPDMQHPRTELLDGLYACGLRYLALAERLGHEVDLAHLRRFAANASAALGLLRSVE